MTLVMSLGAWVEKQRVNRIICPLGGGGGLALLYERFIDSLSS